MKTIILSIILFSNQLLALEWYDFEIEKSYVLKSDIFFEKEEINLKKGNHFKLFEIISLPMQVSIFQFEVGNCSAPDISTEMIIVDSFDSRVGVQLQVNCILEIYVELKDYFTESLFEHSGRLN